MPQFVTLPKVFVFTSAAFLMGPQSEDQSENESKHKGQWRSRKQKQKRKRTRSKSKGNSKGKSKNKSEARGKAKVMAKEARGCRAGSKRGTRRANKSRRISRRQQEATGNNWRQQPGANRAPTRITPAPYHSVGAVWGMAKRYLGNITCTSQCASSGFRCCHIRIVVAEQQRRPSMPKQPGAAFFTVDRANPILCTPLQAARKHACPD